LAAKLFGGQRCKEDALTAWYYYGKQSSEALRCLISGEQNTYFTTEIQVTDS